MEGFAYAIAVQVTMMALTGIIGWLSGRVKGAAKERELRAEHLDKERDDNRAIMRLLLYYRLKDLFTQYVLERKPITSADKHEVEEVYTYYHARGGNGEGTRMYKAIMELQVNS